MHAWCLHLEINEKTQILTRTRVQGHHRETFAGDIIDASTPPEDNGYQFLGIPISDHDAYIAKTLDRKLDQLRSYMDQLDSLRIKQDALCILLKSFCKKFLYIPRNLEPKYTEPFCTEALRLCLGGLAVTLGRPRGFFDEPGHEVQALQAKLDFRNGGLGLGHEAYAKTAYIGRCVTVLQAGFKDHSLHDLLWATPLGPEALKLPAKHPARITVETAAQQHYDGHGDHVLNARLDWARRHGQPLTLADLGRPQHLDPNPPEPGTHGPRADKPAPLPALTPRVLRRHLDDLLTKDVDESSRIAERNNPGDTPEARHRRALVTARAPQAGLALMVTPWSKNLELQNEAVQLLGEQYLGLEVQAVMGLRHCTCNQGGRRTDLRAPHNTYHALGCVRANPGKKAHMALSRHMANFVQAHTTCEAGLEPHVGATTDQQKRVDVRIETPEKDAKALYVDVSTTCALLHFTTVRYPTAPVPDFRGNLVPATDLPLHAAQRREATKVATYADLVKARGGTFSPYVLQTSGGLGHQANHVLRLIRKYASRAGCRNPDGLTFRFIQEQACIQARCNARLVRDLRDACRGAYKGSRHDHSWLPARTARDALRPFRI